MFKVNGASPPVGADKVELKDGDVVLWYWATFGDSGGPPTLLLQRAANGCYTVAKQNDAGTSTAAVGAVLLVDGRTIETGAARACIGPHRGLVRAVARGRSARTRCRSGCAGPPLSSSASPRWSPAAAGGAAAGTATVWVTRDRGQTVLLTKSVPAGLTAMQALRRVTHVKTRYGGRFVQAIDGIEGSLAAKHDWFYFVNGIEADQGAVEYRLRAGDVEWWDSRSWRGEAERAGRRGVLPGALPARLRRQGPGGGGRYETKDMRPLAFALANLVGAKSVAQARAPVLKDRNLLLVVPGQSILTASLRTPGGGAGSPVVFRVSTDVGLKLVKDPTLARHPVPGARVRPAVGLALLASLAAAALLAQHWVSIAVLVVILIALCVRAPASRRRPYLIGCAVTAGTVFVLTPLVEVIGSHPLWTGPSVPVLGPLDVTSEELSGAGIQALRLAAVTLAFAGYALLLDHDRLLGSARFARRSALAVALATRLVPTLERDAAGLAVALRGRGIEVAGLRGRARLLSPLVSGSLERAANLAEAMEARGFGRTGSTRVPQPAWTRLERLALVGAAALVAGGVLWL